MYYSREQHKRFLDKELTAISEAYLKLLNSKAISLLSSNEIYVTQYIKLDFKQPEDPSNADKNVLGSGQLMLRFKKDKGIPRKNEYFTAVILEKDMCLPKNWGEITWGELRSHQVEFSEVHCVWQGKADDNGFLLCGFSGISIEMSQYLINNKLEGSVIVLGPQEPPMEYYQNLISVVGNTSESLPARTLLDFEKSNILWNPEEINSNSSQIDRIIRLLEEKNEMIIQGPPGTGKTHLMAGLVAQLIQNNKSVLVTAMTNRALIELAEKDSLKDALAQKKVKKTNVSSDEIIACKNLCPVDSKQITCMPGCVTLSTFYNSSGWAKTCYEERPFDYVIMDEASQALFGMIAASMNLGKKIIWIGDQNQMQPIVLLSEETLVRNDYYMLANGFQTLCDNFSFPSFILTESHRLLPNAAALTSSFYHTPIKSVADFDYIIDSNKFPFAPKDGGCTILYKEMPVGEKADRHSCLYAIDIITKLLSIYPDIKVAVLSKFRATVRMLQNCFISQHGSKNNVLIDTVERVQGMTCDVCLYFIPNTMTNMSLDKALFNVATSRAKQLTIIVADKSIAHNVCDKDVNMFMQKIITGNIEQLTSKGNDTEDNSSELHSGLKVVGKIDLSQFETPKQKAVKSQIKKNIYIIDTNVFVNCPNIISKLDEKYLVVLSAKVIDELDKLKIKLSNEDKKNVETALRCINRALDKPNVKMELSDLSLLPNDFDKRSPDNNILTVALKFKDENPILLTSDNGLQVKAKGLNMKTISLKDFLKK